MTLLTPRGPLLVAAVTLAGLLIAGCGDEDDREGSSTGEPNSVITDDAPCGELDDATATEIIGRPATVEGASQAGVPACQVDAGGESSAVTLLTLEGEGDLDRLIEGAALGDCELVRTAIDLAGADAAEVVDETCEEYGSEATTVSAVSGATGFTVFPSGVTRAEEVYVAAAILEAALGEEISQPRPDVAPALDGHPCELLDADEVGDVLGAPVDAQRVDSESGSVTQCLYGGFDGSDVDADVFLADIRSQSRLDSLVAIQERTGATATEIEVAGLDQVYLVVQDSLPDQVAAYIATSGTVLTLDVDAGTAAESDRLVTELLPLIAK